MNENPYEAPAVQLQVVDNDGQPRAWMSLGLKTANWMLIGLYALLAAGMSLVADLHPRWFTPIAIVLLIPSALALLANGSPRHRFLRWSVILLNSGALLLYFLLIAYNRFILEVDKPLLQSLVSFGLTLPWAFNVLRLSQALTPSART